MASADSARRNCATPIETVTLPISLPVARRVSLASEMRRRTRSATARAGLEIRSRKHRDQFLAAVAGCEIDFANAFLQYLGHQPKHLVADLMAIIVVEFLEVIDVDQEDAERLVLFHRRDLGEAEEFIHRVAVGEAGQRIGIGALLGGFQQVADAVQFLGGGGETGLQR